MQTSTPVATKKKNSRKKDSVAVSPIPNDNARESPSATEVLDPEPLEPRKTYSKRERKPKQWADYSVGNEVKELPTPVAKRSKKSPAVKGSKKVQASSDSVKCTSDTSSLIDEADAIHVGNLNDKLTVDIDIDSDAKKDESDSKQGTRTSVEKEQAQDARSIKEKDETPDTSLVGGEDETSGKVQVDKATLQKLKQAVQRKRKKGINSSNTTAGKPNEQQCKNTQNNELSDATIGLLKENNSEPSNNVSLAKAQDTFPSLVKKGKGKKAKPNSPVNLRAGNVDNEEGSEIRTKESVPVDNTAADQTKIDKNAPRNDNIMETNASSREDTTLEPQKEVVKNKHSVGKKKPVRKKRSDTSVIDVDKSLDDSKNGSDCSKGGNNVQDFVSKTHGLTRKRKKNNAAEDGKSIEQEMEVNGETNVKGSKRGRKRKVVEVDDGDDDNIDADVNDGTEEPEFDVSKSGRKRKRVCYSNVENKRTSTPRRNAGRSLDVSEASGELAVVKTPSSRKKKGRQSKHIQDGTHFSMLFENLFAF